jgi:hypothetical protein
LCEHSAPACPGRLGNRFSDRGRHIHSRNSTGNKNGYGTFNGRNLFEIDQITAIEKLLKGTKPADPFLDEQKMATILIANVNVWSFVKRCLMKICAKEAASKAK